MPGTKNSTTRSSSGSRGRRILALTVALGLPFLAAVMCYGLALSGLVSGLPGEILRLVGDAALVACVLAAIGELYLRLRLTEDSILDGVRRAISEMFGLLEAAPEELQTAVKQFANAEVYANSVVWRVELAWQDQAKNILQVKQQVRKNLLVVSREGYRPAQDLGVFHSTEGLESKHLAYDLHCPDADVNVRVQDGELTRYCQLKGDRVVLRQDKLLQEQLPDRRWIEHGQTFDTDHVTLMYRHSSGYLPFIHLDFEKWFQVEISGPALPDLRVAAFHPKNSEGSHHKFDTRRDGRHNAGWHNVIPGQGTILSWRLNGGTRPRGPRVPPATPDQPSPPQQDPAGQ